MKYGLRVSLFLTGAIVVWLGLNVGLGGFETLGWQGAKEFFAVTDPETFAVQDNHIRFIAGVWLSVGLILIAGSIALYRLRSVLIVLTGMVFVGGLMRFSSADGALLVSNSIAPSLIAELIAFPLLGFWIFKATKKDAGQSVH